MTGVYTMKKVVSLLLALAMCLSVTSFAWADGITTEEGLVNAIDSAENGATITLTGNIDLTAKLVVPVDKTFTLDLNGHNITQTAEGVNAINLSAGDNVTITGTGTITGNNNGIYVPAGATLTVTGGTIKAVAYNGIYNEGIVFVNGGTLTGGTDGDLKYNGIYNRGTVTVNDGTITGENHGIYNGDSWETEDETGKPTGSIVKYKGTLTVNGGTFSSIYNDIQSQSTATINDGDFSNAAVFNATEVTGGTFNNISFASGATVKDATINGKISWYESHKESSLPAFTNIIFGENAVLNGSGTDKYVIDREGKTVVKGTASKLTVKSENTDMGEVRAYYFFNNDRGTYTGGGEMNNVAIINGKTLTVEAVVTSKDPYIFDGWYLNGSDTRLSEGVDENGKLTFATTMAADITLVAKFKASQVVENANAFIQNYDNTNSFEINSTDDMNAFAYAVTNLGKTFEGKTVTLKADLDFTNKTYRVVGAEDHPFKGTFDGNSKTIKNITDTLYGIKDGSASSYCGIFGVLSGAAIKDLTVENSTFTATKGTQPYAGGIAAEAKNSTITNCTVSNVTTSGWFSGAVIGHTSGGVKVEKVTVTGCTADNFKGGAIAGYAESVTISNVTVSNVKAGASLIGHANAAGENAIKIDTVNVDAPDAPLINTTYSETKGSISITGADTSIKTKDVIPADSAAGAKTITVSGGTFNIDVTEYRADNKLVKVETDNGETKYTIVEDGTDVPAGTYTTQPTDPKDGHVVRQDGENSFTVLPDDKGSVSEGTYVTEPTQVPDGYEVVKNDNNTWTVKKSAPRYYYTSSASSDNSTAKDDGKKAPRTFDPGVGIYALTAVLSVTGMVLVGKRKD